jgi:hypothetical protein
MHRLRLGALMQGWIGAGYFGQYVTLNAANPPCFGKTGKFSSAYYDTT